MAAGYRPGGEGGTSLVQILDVKMGAMVAEVPCKVGVDIKVLRFTPDGKRVVVGLVDGTIHLLDALAAKRIRNLTGHTGSIMSLDFNSDGSRLASGGRDGTVRIWRMKDGVQLLGFRDHSEPVHWVAFGPAGKTVASAGRDILVRSLAGNGQPRVLVAKAGKPGAIAFPAGTGQIIWVEPAKARALIWTVAK